MINSISLLYVYIIVIAGVIAFFWRLINKVNNKVNKKVKPEYVYTPDISLNKVKSSHSNLDNKINDDDSPNTNNKKLSHKKVGILTQNEYKFYDQLRVNLEHRFNGAVNINLKIRLADLLTLNEKDNYQSYLNEIQSENIDFVITDKITANVILLIKFDDHLHEREDRINRDKFVDEICHSVGYKINHTQVSKYYNFTTINESIRNGG